MSNVFWCEETRHNVMSGIVCLVQTKYVECFVHKIIWRNMKKHYFSTVCFLSKDKILEIVGNNNMKAGSVAN